MSASKFTARDMRYALSKFATGVTIVTACDDHGNHVGMTASSFNSVSMEPPLILWSVTKTALSSDIFRNAEYFAVHVLSADQKELSNKFARTGEDKFSEVNYTIDQNNVPLLTDALVRFDCTTWAVYEGGDHWIVIDLDSESSPCVLYCLNDPPNIYLRKLENHY